jgi:hypothetical protein
MSLSFEKVLQESFNSGELFSILESSKTLGEVSKKLGYTNHGRNTGRITIFLAKNDLVFKNHTQKTQEFITKKCVQCGNDFTVPSNNKEKQKQLTCSHACSAAYPEFKNKRVLNKIGIASSYPIVAERNGLTYCCICGEKEVIDIHHLDEDRTNNDITNLVALCPTHHAYMHRGKQDLIFDKLLDYLDNRKT